WFEAARPHLVECIEYARLSPLTWNGLIPKLGSQSLLNAIESAKERFPNLDRRLSPIPTAYPLHFKKSAYNWVSFSYEEAPSYDSLGVQVPQTKVGQI